MRTTPSRVVTRWAILALTGVILSVGQGDAQQEAQMGAPNPYLRGTEGGLQGAPRVDKLYAYRHRPAVGGQDGP